MEVLKHFLQFSKVFGQIQHRFPKAASLRNAFCLQLSDFKTEHFSLQGLVSPSCFWKADFTCLLIFSVQFSLQVSIALHLFAIPFMPVVTVNRRLCLITVIQKLHCLYDFPGLGTLWDKVPDLRSSDTKMVSVLYIPKLESRTDLNWMEAVQTKDRAEGQHPQWKAVLPGTLSICQDIFFLSVNWLCICKLFDSSQTQTHACIFCIKAVHGRNEILIHY